MCCKKKKCGFAWVPPEARAATRDERSVNWFGWKRNGNHNSSSVLVSAVTLLEETCDV